MRSYFVHRLVLLTFVGPRPAGMVVRHFPDRNPNNNCLSNIQYGTPKENSADQLFHGTATKGQRNGCAKLTDDDVKAIKEALSKGAVGSQVAKKYKVSRSTISLINVNRAWKNISPEAESERNEQSGEEEV